MSAPATPPRTAGGAAWRWWPLVIAVAVALVCLAGFWELAEDLASSPTIAIFDQRVSAAVQAFRAPGLTAFMLAVTITGGTVVVAAVTVAGFLLMWRRRHDFALYFVLAVAGGSFLTAVLKNRFGRVRPPASSALIDLPSSFSFPSGHAMASLSLAVIGCYLALRSGMRPAAKWAVVAALVLWAALVGVSRVYLGVHWPSDVVASWLLGGAWLALVIGVAESRRRA